MFLLSGLPRVLQERATFSQNVFYLRSRYLRQTLCKALFVVAWSHANVGGSRCAGPFFPRSRTGESEGTPEPRSQGSGQCTFCRHSMLPCLQKYVFDCDLIKASLATVQVWLSESLCCGLRMWCRVFSDRLYDALVVAGAFGSHLSTWVLNWTASCASSGHFEQQFLKRNCLAMNKNSLKEFVSAETYGPIGISVVWRDWDFVSSEAN